MGMWVGRGRKARVAYGFDDIALVPGALTVNPNEVDISWELCGHRYELPIIAAAMDGVVGPKLAIEMGRFGGLAVLNLEGVFSRYANPDDVLERIVSASQEEATKIIQSIYGEPIKEELIHQRIRGRRRRTRSVLQAARPLRADHHRRRYDDRRRRLQGLRGGRRCGHDRLRLRAGHRGAGPRLPLGHGHAAREPAARHAYPGRA